MSNITSTWTYQHIQLVIIIGLCVGIVGAHFHFDMSVPKAEAVTYQRDANVCDLECEIVERTQRIFEDNKQSYMEQARLDALVEIRNVLLDKIDESPYIDYDAMSEKYGY